MAFPKVIFWRHKEKGTVRTLFFTGRNVTTVSEFLDYRCKMLPQKPGCKYSSPVFTLPEKQKKIKGSKIYLESKDYAIKFDDGSILFLDQEAFNIFKTELVDSKI